MAHASQSALQAWDHLNARRPCERTAEKVSQALRRRLATSSARSPADTQRASKAANPPREEVDTAVQLQKTELMPRLSAERFGQENSKLHLQLTHENSWDRRRAVEALQRSFDEGRDLSIDRSHSSHNTAVAVHSLIQAFQCLPKEMQTKYGEQISHDSCIASDVLSSWYGKALLKRFADSSEAVRAAAVTAYLSAVRDGPNAVLQLLPYAIPVLEERLERREQHVQEQSEDVRLALLQAHHGDGHPCNTTHSVSLQTLHETIQLAGNAIAAYSAEVLTILRTSFEDPFHEISMCACACMATLAKTLGRRLQPVSKELTAAALPLTTHRRKAVRCAAVRTVRELMFCGAHEMILEMVAWRDPNVVAIKSFYEADPKVNFCGKLSMDACHTVRLEFVDAIGAWLLGLDERIDHQGRLLPYLLTAACDSHASVRARAVDAIERIGKLYEQDNAKDLKDVLTYLPPAAHNVGWNERGIRCDPWDLHRDGQKVGLPEVFAARPCVGARRVVAANFGHIAHAIAMELGSWRHECRFHAARLLLVYLAYIEDWVLQHVHELVPALCRAMAPMDSGSDSARVVDKARECCECIGLFVPCCQVVEIALARAADTSSEVLLRATALEAAAAFLRGRARVGGNEAAASALLTCLTEHRLADVASPCMRHAAVSALDATVRQPDALDAAQTAEASALLAKMRACTPMDADADGIVLSNLAARLEALNVAAVKA